MKKYATLLLLPLTLQALPPLQEDAARLEKFLETTCPRKEGKTRDKKIQAENVLKNREEIPNEVEELDLKDVLAPGNDEDRWDTGAVEIVGYVAAVEPGGCETGETTNCKAHGDALLCDTHITIVLDPKQAKDQKKHIVVEVTPRIRLKMARQGIDYRTESLKATFHKKWVRIQGWLFFDRIHKGASANTATSSPEKIWRATAWEVHPITYLETTKKPQA